jgi:hypothetical protein
MQKWLRQEMVAWIIAVRKSGLAELGRHLRRISTRDDPSHGEW